MLLFVYVCVRVCVFCWLHDVIGIKIKQEDQQTLGDVNSGAAPAASAAAAADVGDGDS